MSQGKVVIMDSEANLGAAALDVSAAESAGSAEFSPNPRLTIEGSMLNEFDLQGAHYANGSKHVLVDDDMEDVDRLRPPSRADSQDSCHTEDAEERGELNVVVKRSTRAFNRTNSAYVAGIPVYPMEKRPRGLALIIEIEQYENDVQERRIGSHHDVTNLTKLFEALHFKVLKRQNLTRVLFWREIKAFADNRAHHQADMMILVVLSHGRDGHVYTADNAVVATEKIYEKFNNQHCPALKGKPKFFIIQACRGQETDVGHIDESEAVDILAGRSKKRRAGSMEMDATPFPDQGGDVNRARPTWEDMLVAYSTIPGYASMRDHDLGTWFIQSLVGVFMNHAHDKELIDLLRMTSERLSMFTNEYGEKQTCNVEMRHLYKRIYFNPGLPVSTHGSESELTGGVGTPPSSPSASRSH